MSIALAFQPRLLNLKPSTFRRNLAKAVMDDGSIHCVAGEVFVPESGATFGSIATSQLGAWLHFVPLVQLFHSFSFFFPE